MLAGWLVELVYEITIRDLEMFQSSMMNSVFFKLFQCFIIGNVMATN